MSQSHKIDKEGGAWINIPTLNEEGNILPLLKDIGASMAGLRYHVCIIDDGSKDKTLDIINSYIIECKSELANNIHVISRKKTYKGFIHAEATVTGFRRGLEQTNCGVFVDMDADFAHSPSELKLGIQIIQNGFDVAIASKYLPESRVLDRPWTRVFLSYVYNWFYRRLVDKRIKDYSNGYRFYSRKATELICKHKLKYVGPEGLCEILAVVLSKGLKVKEFPTVYKERSKGVSKVTLLDIIKAGMRMIDISLMYHLTRE